MSKTILTILIILAKTITVFAQSYPCETIGVDDGLSQGFVYQIKEDKKGFLWIGTRMGLNRYDGYSFKNYYHQTSNKYSISGNDVSTIFSDTNDFLFIHSDSKGMDLYFPVYDAFLHLNEGQAAPFHLLSNVIYWATGDERGNYYILTGKGLHHITVLKNQNTDYNKAFSSIEEAFFENYSFQNKIIPLSDSLFKKWTSGYMFYENDKFYFYGPTCSEEVRFSQPEIPIFKPELQHSRDRKKPCFIVHSAPLNKDVYIYDHGIVVDNEFIATADTFPSFRTNFASDNAGNVWITQTNSVICFNIKNKTYQKRTLEINIPEMSYIGFYSVFVDKSGVMFVGSVGRGIFKVNTEPKNFKSITKFEANKTAIYGLSENLSGHVLAECEQKLMEVDLINGQFLRSLKSNTPNDPRFNINNSRNAIEVSPGLYYVVQYSNVWLWNERLQTANAVYLDPQPGIFSSFFLDDEKNLWTCSSEGLIQLNTITQSIKKYPLPIQTTIGFNSWRLTGMIYRGPHSNDVWVCSFEGLLKFSISTSTWKVYRSEEGNAQAISQNDVLSICADPTQPERYLWIGTSGSGFSRMDILNETFEHYTTQEGLSNNYVYGILSDDSGRLWMSTNKGISCFNTHDKSFVNYVKQDGLQGSEFNRFASLKMKNGILVFGGVNGITYFRPEEITLRATVPNIVVTAIKINNSLQHPLLKINSPFITSLDLRAHENNISFEFASLDYINPDLNRYRYKMIGVSEEWIDLGSIRTINFSNLSPGSYTLILNGSNGDRVWSDKTHSITILIHPPWWNSWWFLTLIGSALLLITWGAVRYRINKIKELQTVRDRIARDLHDEIGSTLSSISIYNEIVKDKVATTTPDALPLAQRIAAGTQRVMESMSDIVWAINSRNDSFENLISRMRSASQELDENTPFHLSFHADEQLNLIQIGMEERKNIYLIFKESLNNAIKYSGAKHISIDLSLVKNQAILTISDDGKGFEESKIKPGNGLANMRKRAEIIRSRLEIKSEDQKGTIITLTFPIR